MNRHFNRREFLTTSLGAGAALWAGRGSFGADGPPHEQPLPVAAIVTEYRVNSHADVIVGKILDGYDQLGGPGPKLKLASLFTDQVPANDISRAKAKEHGFPIAKTIEEALTLGTDELQVAGVLSIGEHGKYDTTPDTKQRMYPRRRFFDGIAATFRKAGQVAPVFNDKHLAYNWADAKHIYDTAREMEIPFMAGSSVPLAWRVPPLELPLGCQIEEVLMHGYGGMESYGYHALEAMQSMVERRRGGETGVAAVQALTGEKIEEARQSGRWSRELLEAAVATTPKKRRGRSEELRKDAVIFAIEYRDGLKAALAMNTGLAYEFAFAGRLKGPDAVRATWFELQEGKPYYHFAFLVEAFERMVHTGKPAYPVERTLLVTGVLDAALHSLAEGGTRKETPHLAIEYEAGDWPFARGRAPAPRENP